MVARTVAALIVLVLAWARDRRERAERAGPRQSAEIGSAAEAGRRMRFEWVREGPAEKCGSTCNEWVSAKGAIMPDTARDFEAFARTRDIAGKVMVLESPGGAATAGLALGRAFRRLNMTVTVGQTVMLPADRPVNSARPIRRRPSARRCVRSFCSGRDVGTFRRRHAFWCTRSGRARNAPIPRLRSTARSRSPGCCAIPRRLPATPWTWAARSSCSTSSMRIPPWEDLRSLTNIEVQRTRLNTIDTPFARRTPMRRFLAAAGRAAADRRPVRVLRSAGPWSAPAPTAAWCGGIR